MKLIKVGMYDDEVLKRFQSDRQSLAIMDHPSIAKVFDAGATAGRRRSLNPKSNLIRDGGEIPPSPITVGAQHELVARLVL